MKLFLVLTGLALGSAMFGATIVTPNGSPNAGSEISNTEVMAVRFTLGAAYNNVAISASLSSFATGETGTSYLTNSLGAGTTVANQVGSANFSYTTVANFTTLVNVPLFSGLSLGAGTYNVVFTTVGNGHSNFVSRLAGGTYTTAPGTTASAFFTNSPSGYAPASTFSALNYQELFFTVTGDPVIPEPSTLGLFATGAGALWMARRRLRN